MSLKSAAAVVEAHSSASEGSPRETFLNQGFGLLKPYGERSDGHSMGVNGRDGAKQNFEAPLRILTSSC